MVKEGVELRAMRAADPFHMVKLDSIAITETGLSGTVIEKYVVSGVPTCRVVDKPLTGCAADTSGKRIAFDLVSTIANPPRRVPTGINVVLTSRTAVVSLADGAGNVTIPRGSLDMSFESAVPQASNTSALSLSYTMGWLVPTSFSDALFNSVGTSALVGPKAVSTTLPVAGTTPPTRGVRSVSADDVIALTLWLEQYSTNAELVRVPGAVTTSLRTSPPRHAVTVVVPLVGGSSDGRAVHTAHVALTGGRLHGGTGLTVLIAVIVIVVVALAGAAVAAWHFRSRGGRGPRGGARGAAHVLDDEALQNDDDDDDDMSPVGADPQRRPGDAPHGPALLRSPAAAADGPDANDDDSDTKPAVTDSDAAAARASAALLVAQRDAGRDSKTSPSAAAGPAGAGVLSLLAQRAGADPKDPQATTEAAAAGAEAASPQDATPKDDAAGAAGGFKLASPPPRQPAGAAGGAAQPADLSEAADPQRRWHTFANGDSYGGEWANGRLHGVGVYRFANGDRYEGAFANHLRDGRGVFRYTAVKAVYDGEWAGGQKSGTGTYTTPSGTYTGQFANNTFHGEGTLVEASGAQYVGSWVRGLPHGEGRRMWANKSAYWGSFAGGRRSGRGTFVDGQEFYEGEWKDDFPDGMGTQRKPDGSAYVGHFSGGAWEGEGCLYYADGAIYSGGWAKGTRAGRGTFFVRGSIVSGEWVNDSLHGMALYVDPKAKLWTLYENGAVIKSTSVRPDEIVDIPQRPAPRPEITVPPAMLLPPVRP